MFKRGHWVRMGFMFSFSLWDIGLNINKVLVNQYEFLAYWSLPKFIIFQEIHPREYFGASQFQNFPGDHAPRLP